MRVFRNRNALPHDDIVTSVKSALRNPAFAKEIWIVGANLMDIAHIRMQAKNNHLSNRQRQLLMFLESLRTACGRANTRLRIFGH